ncbi:unnamed protein product [Oikopleura dioica]|uniref:Uncharacterized protein n=1 Tax=Oikopleura dioica TaxID=34765 RepID=E4WRI0_OIKDI|nr:unnamed protein product [Oikopleura dioica]
MYLSPFQAILLNKDRCASISREKLKS